VAVYYYGYSDAKADDRWKFWEENRPSAVAVDIETISLDERHPLGIGIAFSPQESFYFQLYPEAPTKALEALKRFLTDVRITKIAHNFMFDMGVFPLIPVIGNSLDRANIFDTNVAARLLGYQETSLPTLASEIGLETTGMGDILKANGCKDNLQLVNKDPMILANHCAEDTRVTYQLYLNWKDKIHQQYGEYFKVEMEVIPILLDLSMHGIALDQQARQDLEDRYVQEVEFYRRHVQSYGIENPGSSQQVGYMLAKRGSFLKFTKSKRQLQTRVGDLEFLDDPLAAGVIGYRKRSKFLSTYLQPLKGEDRFYTEYYLDTVVGRLNSRNRNIQNIPGADLESGDPGARFMLVPDFGLFTTGDYSREHLYILAHMSQDRELLSVLYNPDKALADIHQHTADLMGVPRKLAKVCNFAVIYGATAQTLMEQLKTRDRARCENLLETWFRVYSGAADWIQYAQREGLRDGWSLPTVFNRRIKLPEEGEDAMRRKAVNYPILGSDGEVIKRAIIKSSHHRLGPPIMAITVHDSITWDGDVKDKIPVEELENIPGFRVPFEVKTTFRWE
jgi:DNA polymerase-1